MAFLLLTWRIFTVCWIPAIRRYYFWLQSHRHKIVAQDRFKWDFRDQTVFRITVCILFLNHCPVSLHIAIYVKLSLSYIYNVHIVYLFIYQSYAVWLLNIFKKVMDLLSWYCSRIKWFVYSWVFLKKNGLKILIKQTFIVTIWRIPILFVESTENNSWSEFIYLFLNVCLFEIVYYWPLRKALEAETRMVL